ncbi:lipopolysaccharide biosynthesis protein [Dechloromonas sp. CZR5]|uniref:lipopolysaccharide biosynthesis protein n=1 Tax=Dechloromonas sp. CZR5 TaxID=2608630 RepID=UPI00123D9705|nr:oligosaccharide flippase family protein [Dechloromonas sp. CZR5]
MRLSVFSNAVANAVGRFWSAGLQFVFVPVYVKLLGPEEYGLVGFYTTLLLSLTFLDLCISPVLGREFGRLAERQDSANRMRNLLRSMEMISLGMAAFVSAIVVCSAPWLATHWIHSGSLPVEEVTDAIRLMGLVIACQWLTSLYGSGFAGLHRQDLATKIRVFITTFQWVGAAAILWLVFPSVNLLLIWQALTFLSLTFWLRRDLWRIMPIGNSPRFDVGFLRSTWRFSLGNLMIGLTSSLLTQTDKWIISKYVPLDQFSAYVLTFTMVSPITILVALPAGSAVFPLFSRLCAIGDNKNLSIEYHRWSQLVAAFSLPMVGALLTFGDSFSNLWLHSNSKLVSDLIVILPWVLLGTLFNTLMMVPYFLQVASGWVRLSIYKNIFLLFLFVPTLIFAVPKYGAIVGGWCWLAINVGYYFVEIPIMHRRLLKNEMWSWWVIDTFIPALITAVVFSAANYIFPKNLSSWFSVFFAFLASVVDLLVILLVLPFTRSIVIEKIKGLMFSGGVK